MNQLMSHYKINQLNISIHKISDFKRFHQNKLTTKVCKPLFGLVTVTFRRGKKSANGKNKK